MSDNIPFEIQVEIIKRLPVISLIQFRSVSKTWKSLIDSSSFIAGYTCQHSQVQHLLVSYEDSVDFQEKYVSIADDDIFPQLKVYHTLPLFVNMLKYSWIIGSSHGLLCLYCDDLDDSNGPNPGIDMAVLWNPSIRKAVVVTVPVLIGPIMADGSREIYGNIIGFGVCPATMDPKIVKIRDCIPWQVEVFALSTGAWRTPYSGILPRKSINFNLFGEGLAVNGFIYWLATDRNTMYSNLIISFDLTSEEFGEVNLPDSLARLDVALMTTRSKLSLSKLRETLVVLESNIGADNSNFSVWMMDNGVRKSLTKLFTFNVDNPNASISGFRKSGEVIIEINKDNRGQLVVYDPYSKQFDNLLGMNGTERSFVMHPYMETLLLLDQPNLTVYNQVEALNVEHDMFRELNFRY